MVTIKTFRGRTIAEALAQVKKDLGKDAVILNTRTYRAGGLLGFGAKTFHEITASDQPPASSPRRAPARPPIPAAPAPRLRPAAVPSAPATESPIGHAADQPPAASPASMQHVARMILASQPQRPAIEEELAAIKKMVGQVLRSAQAPDMPGLPEPLFECYQKMLEAEVASEIAAEIASGVKDELRGLELEDRPAVQRAVMRRLAAFVPVCGETTKPSRPADGRPLTIALIGPTGVGKTTTLAKLAATYKLRQGRRVGLITCDTYRIAAVEQLRTYAGIINLPLKVATTPAEVKAAVAALSDCDVILIDTAGRSPRDGARLDELRALLDAAQPHQTHLVLSSAASRASLMSAAERFTPLGCDRVILTKLDEAANFGVLLGVVRSLQTRLSFLTTGQEVPDHIEPASSERLARLVLGLEAPTR